MNKGTFGFKTGSFVCHVVYDGCLKYENPVQLLFPTAPEEERKHVLQAEGIDVESWTEWISDYSCLLVDTGSRRILIDTGMGCFNPFTGRLPENLKSIGVEPETIDYVLFSHGHPDHIGGVVDSADRLVFPNATFMMSKAEWEFWENDPATALAAAGMDEMHQAGLIFFAEKCLPPIKDRLQVITGEEEIVPGIRPVPSFGHTPGHLAFRIESEGKVLLYAGDTFIHPQHIAHPRWRVKTDILPSAAVESRRNLMQLAAKPNTTLAAFHFEFPCLGQVVAENGTYSFCYGHRQADGSN